MREGDEARRSASHEQQEDKHDEYISSCMLACITRLEPGQHARRGSGRCALSAGRLDGRRASLWQRREHSWLVRCNVVINRIQAIYVRSYYRFSSGGSWRAQWRNLLAAVATEDCISIKRSIAVRTYHRSFPPRPTRPSKTLQRVTLLCRQDMEYVGQ